jgi:hypothetical protein
MYSEFTAGNAENFVRLLTALSHINVHAHPRAAVHERKHGAALAARDLPPIPLTPGSLGQLFKRRWRHVVQ